jgi:hypothetical protein
LAGIGLRDDNYSSDDEGYRVPSMKDVEEEPHDEKPTWMEAYAAGVKAGVANMIKDALVDRLVKWEQKNMIYEQQLKKAKMEPVAAGSGTKIKRDMHDTIAKDQMVVNVIGKMEELQKNNPLALWWVTQWGEEFMQRFKKDKKKPGADDDKEALEL